MTTTPTSVDRRTVPDSRERWTLLYDADCGFCKLIVSGVLACDRHNRVVPRALQSAQAHALLSDLSPEDRLASVHLISPDGERFSAGSVSAPLLRLLPAGTIPALGIARATSAHQPSLRLGGESSVAALKSRPHHRQAARERAGEPRGSRAGREPLTRSRADSALLAGARRRLLVGAS